MFPLEERLESFMLSRASTAQFARRWVLPAYSAERFWEQGRQAVAARAKRALAVDGPGSISAYRQFVIDNGLDPDRIARELNGDNFSDLLPIASKAVYSAKYGPQDRRVGGPSKGAVIIQSSGTTGEPTTYYSALGELERSVIQSELHLLSLGLGEVPVWVHMTLALGMWSAGRLLCESVRTIMARKDFRGRPKYHLSLSTPGANTELAARVLTQNLGQLSKAEDLRIVIPGYPPSLKAILETVAAKINLKKHKIYLTPAGEGYSVPWQLYVAQRLLGFDPWEGRNLDRIRGFYGAVDLGSNAATETPLTCLIRLLAWEDKELCRALFDTEDVPTLTQAIPSLFYPEVVGEEAVISTASVFRYNIHDRAAVINFDLMLDILKGFGYDPLVLLKERGYESWETWRAPFLVIYGRSDGAVSFGGALVYPSSVSAALNHRQLAATNTGNFKMHVLFDREQNFDGLEIVVELKPAVEAAASLAEDYERVVLQTLKERSSEFADSYKNQLEAKAGRGGQKRLLSVKLCEFGTGEFAEGGIKYRYV